MKKILFGLPLLLLISGSVGLAQERLPHGKWWRQQRVIQHLGLSEEQQGRLDAIFNQTAPDLIDLKADVDKKGLALRSVLDQLQINRQTVQRAAATLSEARARLFERELMMLMDMRGVLSNDQWTRFRQVLDARHGARSEQGKRPPRRQPSPKKTVPPGQ